MIMLSTNAGAVHEVGHTARGRLFKGSVQKPFFVSDLLVCVAACRPTQSYIGFTMSLFIATLGFGESELLAAAKLGILGASVIAGSLGYVLLRGGSLPQIARG